MDTLENLQRRIAEAFTRIETVAKAVSAKTEGSDTSRQMAEANVQLAGEIDRQKASRVADADQLDTLIGRLKPLLQEVSNA